MRLIAWSEQERKGVEGSPLSRGAGTAGLRVRDQGSPHSAWNLCAEV